jgi:hypothetical protein
LGEVVVVLEGSTQIALIDDDVIRLALAEQLNSGVSVRDAVAHVEESLGVPHRSTYLLAIALRVDDGS